MIEEKLCRICKKPTIAHYLCKKHYQRWRRNGDATKIRKVGAKLKGKCYECGKEAIKLVKVYVCKKHEIKGGKIG